MVANGRDGAPAEQRGQWVTTEMRSLGPLHGETVELDLRDHINRPDALDPVLADIDLIWVTGGDMNVCANSCAAAVWRPLSGDA